MLRLLSALALFLLVLAACGGDDDDTANASDAGNAMADITRTALRGQYGPLWDSLHPEHQNVVSRDTYIDCRQGDRTPEVEIEIDETFDETLDISGLGQTDTIAVTLKLTATSDDSTAFATMHTMQIDGDWVWFLRSEDYDAFESGECPA